MWFYEVFLMISALSGLLFPPRSGKKKFFGVLFELLNAQEPPKSDFSAPKSLPRAIFERKVTLPRPTLGPPGRILDAKMSSNRPLRPGGMRGAIKPDLAGKRKAHVAKNAGT